MAQTSRTREPWPLSYPDDWETHVQELTGPVLLDVAGYVTPVDLRAEQVRCVLLPLLAHVRERREANPAGRLMVGLAGVPGGGKSTFAALLAWVARRVWPAGGLVVLGMDGWHWPNAVLDRRTIVDLQGRRVPLRRRKGGPESFDVDALANALQRLKAGEDLRLPVYDRRLHDPRPEALCVGSEAGVVLVEGNYLLSPQPPWVRLLALWDLRLFLECDLDRAATQIMGRHMKGGSSEQEARDKYESNDRLNMVAVAATEPQAELTVQWFPAPRLRA
ncbi:MAG: nucleoside/nucleotide kinase family protein [Phycisphaerae bacterium]